jgi:hypothetical protein
VNRYALLIVAASIWSPLSHAQLVSKPAATRPAGAPIAVKAQAVRLAQARAIAMVNNVKQQRENMRNSAKNIPDGGTFKFDDLIHFSIVDGRIKAEWKADKIPVGQQRRIKIEGSDALWLVNVNNGPNRYFNLARYDLDGPPDGFWMSQISCQEGVNVLSMYAQGAENSEIAQLSFVQQPTILSLSLYGGQNNIRRLLLNTSATDLIRLRSEHPDEVCRHLIPLLRKMTGQPLMRPGAGDVYRVFTDIPADPAMTRKIESYLPALTSIDPAERDKATQKLRELGAPAALAALRLDPGLLLPEQLNRLNALVSLHSRVIVDDPAEMLKDPNFLLDCFEDDDVAVRIDAKSALEKIFGHPIDFDPQAPAAKRAAVAENLRRKLEQLAAQRRIVEQFEIP